MSDAAGLCEREPAIVARFPKLRLLLDSRGRPQTHGLPPVVFQNERTALAGRPISDAPIEGVRITAHPERGEGAPSYFPLLALLPPPLPAAPGRLGMALGIARPAAVAAGRAAIVVLVLVAAAAPALALVAAACRDARPTRSGRRARGSGLRRRRCAASDGLPPSRGGRPRSGPRDRRTSRCGRARSFPSRGATPRNGPRGRRTSRFGRARGFPIRGATPRNGPRGRRTSRSGRDPSSPTRGGTPRSGPRESPNQPPWPRSRESAVATLVVVVLAGRPAAAAVVLLVPPARAALVVADETSTLVPLRHAAIRRLPPRPYSRSSSGRNRPCSSRSRSCEEYLGMSRSRSVCWRSSWYGEATRRQQCDGLSDGVVVEPLEALPRALVTSLDLLHGQAARRRGTHRPPDEAASSRCPVRTRAENCSASASSAAFSAPRGPWSRRFASRRLRRSLRTSISAIASAASAPPRRDPAQHLPLDERCAAARPRRIPSRSPAARRRRSSACPEWPATPCAGSSSARHKRTTPLADPCSPDLASAPSRPGVLAVVLLGLGPLRRSLASPWRPCSLWASVGTAQAVSDMPACRSSPGVGVDFSDSLEDLSAGLAMARAPRWDFALPTSRAAGRFQRKLQSDRAGVFPVLAQAKAAATFGIRRAAGGESEGSRAASGTRSRPALASSTAAVAGARNDRIVSVGKSYNLPVSVHSGEQISTIFGREVLRRAQRRRILARHRLGAHQRAQRAGIDEHDADVRRVEGLGRIGPRDGVEGGLRHGVGAPVGAQVRRGSRRRR